MSSQVSVPVKAPITTHVLNLDLGKPAANLQVRLFGPEATEPLALATTDSDGRILTWGSTFALTPGIYRLEFFVGDWYARQGRSSFYPLVPISFEVRAIDEDYHVPLLLNAHGYSTYRGS